MKKLWYVIWAPGYIQLWLMYNSPIEWGKKRSVAETARKWKNRHWFAPVYSVGWYFLIWFFTGAESFVASQQ